MYIVPQFRNPVRQKRFAQKVPYTSIAARLVTIIRYTVCI